MSETSDYTPAHWTGHDFSSARSYYDTHAGRSYSAAVKTGKTTTSASIRVEELKTDSNAPLIIAADVTGSMGEWPAVMFSKLPYLELEGQTYLGKDMEIAWMGIGDALSDQYPLQVRPFAKGTDLKTRLEELVIEGNGGGQVMESYQLGAFYMLHKASMPNAIHPIFIMIGDEKTHPFITSREADIAGVPFKGNIPAKEVFVELKKKMAVYLIQKPYNVGAENDYTNKEIHNDWVSILGDDHIAYLSEPERVVDVIFGILAKETGKIDDFKTEIEDRQTEDQVKTVYKALKTVHLLPAPVKVDTKVRTGKSNMLNPTKTKKSKSLI